MLPLVMACTSAPVQSADSPDPPSAYSWADTADEELEADPQAFSAAVDQLVQQLRSFRADAVLTAYDAAMAFASESCPSVSAYSSAQGDVLYWDKVCQTPEEMQFKGPMTDWRWSGHSLYQTGVEVLGDFFPNDELLYTGRGLMGQTDIYARQGAEDFNCSCFAMQGEGQGKDGTATWFSWVDGPAHWTGPETAGTWLESGDLRLGLWQYYRVSPDQSVGVELRGGATGLDDRYDSIWMGMKTYRSAEGACEADAEIQLRVRDGASARWVEQILTLDEACQACGEMEGIGSVCVDLSPLFLWEGSPW